jgi:CubicO group peptidase (beta-lactamase class C family)
MSADALSVEGRADSRFNKTRELIQKRVADDIPSFGVSVVYRGEILWEESFGWADRELGLKVTPDTVYPVASVAKSMTATGVMLLAEKGLVDLDQPIETFLGPENFTPLSGASQSAKVRDLLTMTAGFPMGFKGVFETYPVPSRQQLLLHHGGIQVFPPGEVFHYSNFSLGMAEIVIEQATGEAFGPAMQELLFKPAGMVSTFYSGSPATDAQVVTAYEENGEPYPSHTAMPAGGGGVNASLSDLRRYAQAHLGNPPSVIPAAVRKAMHSEITQGSNGMFAVGWWVIDLGGDMNLVVSDGHGSSMALVQLMPNSDLAVVCLMSVRKYDPDGKALTNKVATQVMDTIMPGFGEKYEQFFADLAEADQLASSYRPTPAVLGRWSGHVRTWNGDRIGVEFMFQPDGDIHVTLQDQYTVLFTEARYRNGILEGWFPGVLPTDVAQTGVQDISGKIRVTGDRAQGYLNVNFDDQRGVYDLSSYLYLERDANAN